MGRPNSHLDDAAFADVWADRLATGGNGSTHAADQHLQGCAECRTRFAQFSRWMEGLRDDARQDAEVALSAERLAAQQAQILRRLEGLEHPAKVIAFPRFARPVSSQPTGRQRWIAAAAAAGLIAGVALGQLLELGGGAPVRESISAESTRLIARAPGQEASPRMVPAVSTVSDESILFELDQELLPSSVRVPESLQYLNAITPGARDYEAR